MLNAQQILTNQLINQTFTSDLSNCGLKYLIYFKSFDVQRTIQFSLITTVLNFTVETHELNFQRSRSFRETS